MCRSRSLNNLLALASAAALAVGCNGEQAFSARDASPLVTGGGGDLGAGGTPGSGGSAGAGAMTGGTTGSGGTVVTGTGGQAGAGGLAGAAGGHAGSMGGMSGTAGMGVGGMAGSRPVGPKNLGDVCAADNECMSSYCADGVCCNNACIGTCRTCVGTSSTTKGQCGLADSGQDPRNDCADETGTNPCGKVGVCGSGGVCKMVAAGTKCSSVQMCDAAGGALITEQDCDGNGTCKNAPSQSCNGFACAGGACNTNCTDNTACVAGGFCSARTCVGTPNLAGNGDAETGTTAGWVPANGGRALAVSSTATSGYAHGGTYSIVETGRTQFFVGPAYNLPTGLGQYTLTLWAMQTDDGVFQGVPQIELKCRDTTLSAGASYIQLLSDFAFSLPAMTWTKVTATVNTLTDGGTLPDCFAANPPGGGPAGLVKSAILYLNQPDFGTTPPTPAKWPDLYMDDVVVQVPAGQNLVGNPNFEAAVPAAGGATMNVGATDGWTATPTAPAPTVSTVYAHGGTASLVQSGRTSPSAGIVYQLPLGAARYQFSFWVMQTGTTGHALVLQPSYTCLVNGTMQAVANAAPIVLPGTGKADAGNWVNLTGTVILPPVDAPAGCVMSQASVTLQQAETGVCGSTVECPDVYLDDASISLQ